MANLEIQLGKNGITKKFIEDIEKRLEKYRNATLKIKVLKSARESREDMKNHAGALINALGEKYTCRIVGFTIILRKWRKARTNETGNNNL